MITREQWAIDWCNYNGWATSDNNVKSTVIWIVSEGSDARWNPLDTTQPGQPGDSDFNSAGVKNYISLSSGLEASRQTVVNGYYNSIIACYQRSASPAETCHAICNTPWGSQPTPNVVAQVLSNYAANALVPIAGSEGTVNPPTPNPTGDAMPDPKQYPGLYIRWCYRFLLYREVDPGAYGNDMTFLSNGGNPEQLFVNIQDSAEGVAAIKAQRKVFGI